jgi:hypothetical protein
LFHDSDDSDEDGVTGYDGDLADYDMEVAEDEEYVLHFNYCRRVSLTGKLY